MIGPLIGAGYTAEVFDAGDGKAVKLFYEGYPAASVRAEFANAQLLGQLDIPVIQSYELIEYEGRHGIVYERAAGQSMLKLLLQTGDIEQYAAALAALHKQIVACTLPEATPLIAHLRRNIEAASALDERARLKLLAKLDTLPDGEQACHGDFHFGNVVTEQERSYIIDYMNVCRGHPHGDAARTVYLIEMTPVPAGLDNVELVRAMKKQGADIYLQQMGISRESLLDWLVVTAAARLTELADDHVEERTTVLEFLSEHGIM